MILREEHYTPPIEPDISAREAEILLWPAQGKGNPEILGLCVAARGDGTFLV